MQCHINCRSIKTTYSGCCDRLSVSIMDMLCPLKEPKYCGSYKMVCANYRMRISFFRSSQSCTSPPLTPKSQRRTTQKTASQGVVSDVDDFSSYATIPCNCSCDVSTSATTTSTSNGQNKNAYFNYDIPRTLYKQVRINIIPKPENTHSHYKGKYCCMAAWLHG